MRKLIWICLVLLLLLTAGCGRNDPQPTSPHRPGSQTEQSTAEEPTEEPIEEPIEEPTEEPTEGPTEEPTGEPTEEPTGEPTEEPTKAPNPTSGGAAPQPERPSAACPSVNGALHVEGTRLVDKTGAPVQLRGVSTHGLAWFPGYVDLDCFRQLRQEWNVNVIRLALYTAEYGGYCSGGDRAALKALIDQGVRYAAEADMYVIIDWHILSDGDPNLHREEALAFFGEMSARYAGMDHVIYEICNEPNGQTTWQDVKTYALDVLERIRQNDPEAVILVGTPNWSQSVDLAAADPIREYDNLMYTLHFYAATHKDDLRSRMITAVKSGLPVFVSEYGICDASGSGYIDIEQANAWIDLLDQYGVSYVAWNLSNKDESSSILRPECGKTAGFTADDLSACGQWLYERLTGTTPARPSWGEGSKEPSRDPTQPPQNNVELKTDSLEITLTMVNSWSAENAVYRQYSVMLKNISGTVLSGWTVTIPFQESFILSDSWNGVFSVQNTDLIIASVDYNGTVPAGETVRDIGFIIRFMQ